MIVYLSSFSVSSTIERNPFYDKAVNYLLSCLSNIAEEVIFRPEFTSYEDIESSISRSSIYVAVIDEYWNSATYKLHEVYYAAGIWGKKTGSCLTIETRKIFFFLADDKPINWIDSVPQITILPNNLDDAKTILNDKIII